MKLEEANPCKKCGCMCLSVDFACGEKNIYRLSCYDCDNTGPDVEFQSFPDWDHMIDRIVEAWNKDNPPRTGEMK